MRKFIFKLLFTKIERAHIINALFRRAMDKRIDESLLDPKEPVFNYNIRVACNILAIELS